MNCPVCLQFFKNNNMSVQQHIINCNDEKHQKFKNQQQEIIFKLKVEGYTLKEIVSNENVIFGRKFITKTINLNPNKIKEHEKKLQDELSKLFVDGNSIQDIYVMFNKKISRQMISKYLHNCFNEKDFIDKANENKNKKIKTNQILKNPSPKKGKEYIEKSCVLCNNKFLTKNYIKKFCSKKCVTEYVMPFVKEGLKKNPPNCSERTKLTYANGKKTVSGGTTKWISYKNIKVQGTYELRTCIILDKMKENNMIYDWEYTNDKFPYVGIDNEKHTYMLDFKIFNNDGSFYYIETKGYQKENDELKWESVRNHGYKLVVWFNEDIKLQEKNLNIL